MSLLTWLSRWLMTNGTPRFTASTRVRPSETIACGIFRPRLAFSEGHDVVVECRQRLRLEIVPEPLRIRLDPLVGHGTSGDIRLQPSGGDAHVLVVGETVEERSLHELRLERTAQQLCSAGRRRNHFVGR